MKKFFKVFIVTAIILYIGVLASNLIGGKFDSLPKDDQNVLNQFSKFSKGPGVWENYDLKNRSLLFVNNEFGGSAYLINPVKKPNSLFAKEINVPGGLKAYRISGFYPGVLKLKATPGYFNSVDDFFIFKKHPKVLGTPVYYLKYTRDKNINTKIYTNYFMPYLAHEAFHFFMQENWASGGRFTGQLSDTDLNLLKEEYEVLSEVQKAMLEKKEANWNALGKKYVEIMDKRIKSNPTYLKDEMAMETAEGTATYVGIKAARNIGYDFGIMYSNSEKNVPFNKVMDAYDSKKINTSFLSDHMPYETGAQLCFLLDKLNKINWQDELNKQTLNKPVYLYDLVKKSIKQ